MPSSFAFTSTEVVDNPEKEHFSASVGACSPANYDLILEFALDDGSPGYSSVVLIASKSSIKELLAVSEKLSLPVGNSVRWKSDAVRRTLIAPIRRATLFHVSIASSHGIAIVSPAMFDMLALMSIPQNTSVLNVPAFMSISLSIEAFADLLVDIRQWADKP